MAIYLNFQCIFRSNFLPFISVYFAEAVAVLKTLNFFRNAPHKDLLIIITYYFSLLQGLSSPPDAICNKAANIVTT